MTKTRNFKETIVNNQKETVESLKTRDEEGKKNL